MSIYSHIITAAPALGAAAAVCTFAPPVNNALTRVAATAAAAAAAFAVSPDGVGLLQGMIYVAIGAGTVGACFEAIPAWCNAVSIGLLVGASAAAPPIPSAPWGGVTAAICMVIIGFTAGFAGVDALRAQAWETQGRGMNEVVDAYDRARRLGVVGAGVGASEDAGEGAGEVAGAADSAGNASP